MKGSGLAPFGFARFGQGEWHPPEISESEMIALKIGFHYGSRKKIRRKKRGRPKKAEYGGVDCFRAFKIWEFVNNFDDKNLRNKSNRYLIDLVRAAEEAVDLPERTFPNAGNFESSVARGKSKLKIDGRWKSEVCEKIKRI